MKIKRRALIEFFDVRHRARARHVSGITGLLGESLGAALAVHKLRQDGFSAEVLEGTPTTGQKAAPWLDRWIAARKGDDACIYQVEIKNWSSYSKGGTSLAMTTDEHTYRQHAIQQWEGVFHGSEIPDKKVGKVMRKMRVPPAYASWDHRALVCFWFCIHPNGLRDAWFAIPTSGDFSHLEIFSMSAYLRTLSDDPDLEMPHVEERLSLLKSILHL